MGHAWRPGLRASERALCVLGALACLAVLGVGAWLVPSGRGYGTHEQLGLGSCRWAAELGRPCPTCGMTTAVSAAAHGRMLGAFAVQPMGAVVALGLSAGFWGFVHAGVGGARVGMWAGRMLSGRVLWVVAALAGASWAYKWVTWPG